jgi:hypothetical protein
MDEMNLDGLELTRVVKAWMDERGWQDAIEVNEDRTASTVQTTMTIREQVYKIYIEVLETEQALMIYLYSPYQVPKSRIAAMALILNRVNFRLDLGRFATNDGPAARPIQMKVCVDVVGSDLTTKQVVTLMGLGVTAFRTYGSVLAATALTQRPVEELWEAFLQEDDEDEPWTVERVPRLLN